MPSEIVRAIIKTLSYSDVFDYPLTLEEINKYLIKVKILGQRPISLWLKNSKLVGEESGYYFLRGREEVVDIRKRRKKWSKEKLKIAQKVINILKLIPTVKLVGITGALAVNNAKEEDDIDLFIITSNGLLWTTRFLATFIVEAIGKRRHPKEEKVNNKVCLNMFVDENYLEIPKKEQDLFSAHEVLQLKPIWEKNNAYQKFLAANKWAEKYLPNSFRIAVKTPRGWQADPPVGGEAMTPPMVEGLVKSFFNLLERFLKSFQLWYMRNRRTTEVIKEGIIRFHPQDAREWVMKEYRRRISNSLIQSHRISIAESF